MWPKLHNGSHFRVNINSQCAGWLQNCVDTVPIHVLLADGVIANFSQILYSHCFFYSLIILVLPTHRDLFQTNVGESYFYIKTYKRLLQKHKQKN